MTNQVIEQEFQAKGLTAPCVTLSDVEASIVHEGYLLASHAGWQAGPGWSEDDNDVGSPETLTLCFLILRNGVIVTGESACATPESFDAEIGRKAARQDAINKVRPLLLVYELERQLAEQDAAL